MKSTYVVKWTATINQMWHEKIEPRFKFYQTTRRVAHKGNKPRQFDTGTNAVTIWKSRRECHVSPVEKPTAWRSREICKAIGI